MPIGKPDLPIMAGATRRPHGPTGRRERESGLLGGVAVLLCCLVLSAPGAATAASLLITPLNAEVDMNESFTLDLRVEGLGAGGAPSLGGFDIDITFDTSILELDAVVFGDPGLGNQLALGGFSAIQIESTLGGSTSLLELSLAPTDVLEAMQAPAFDLVQLQFRAVGLGVTSVQIEPGAMLANAAGGAISVDAIQSGSVTAVPEPSAALLFAAGIWLASRPIVRRARA